MTFGEASQQQLDGWPNAPSIHLKAAFESLLLTSSTLILTLSSAVKGKGGRRESERRLQTWLREVKRDVV